MTEPVYDYSLAKDRLWRRFELTIPLGKPVVVHYRDLVLRDDQRVIGVPAHNKRHVIYVMVQPGQMRAIPKACVIDIKPLYPNA